MPKKVSRNEADFSEVFDFAVKEFNVGWNQCNKLFFGTILDYQKHNDFELKVLEGDLDPNFEWCATGSNKQAKEIMVAFMKKHGLAKLRVYNG